VPIISDDRGINHQLHDAFLLLFSSSRLHKTFVTAPSLVTARLLMLDRFPRFHLKLAQARGKHEAPNLCVAAQSFACARWVNRSFYLAPNSLSLVSYAKRCDFGTRKINETRWPEDYNTAGLVFESQDAITTKLQGCTSLVDDINIPFNYSSKTVDLSGINELATLKIQGYNITEILLPDVEKMENLLPPEIFYREYGTRLTSFNASKLVTIEYIGFDMSDIVLELPALTKVTNLRITRSVKG
jgi:hypothetical protein